MLDVSFFLNTSKYSVLCCKGLLLLWNRVSWARGWAGGESLWLPPITMRVNCKLRERRKQKEVTHSPQHLSVLHCLCFLIYWT